MNAISGAPDPLLDASGSQSEAWTPLQLVSWIATRSRDFVGKLKGLHFVEFAEDALYTRLAEYPPVTMTIAEGFAELCKRRGSLTPHRGDWPRHDDGALAVFNIHEFNRFDMSFAPSDAMQLWPIHRGIRAFNLAMQRPWRKPRKAPATWAKQLPAGELLPLAKVLDAIASRGSAGSTDLVGEQGVRFSVCISILEAAAAGSVKLYGAPCRRSSKTPQELDETESRIEIESRVAATLSPILDGNSDWLGPSQYARSFESNGHAPESVSFSRTVLERKSLLSWLSEPPPKLSEKEVKERILAEQRVRPNLGIGEITAEIRKVDPTWPRNVIRELAKNNGVFGKRGRPKKSAN